MVELTAPEMRALLDAQGREIIRLRRQVAWFQRQIFGQKSERRMPEPEGVQGTLGEAFDVVPDDAAPAKKINIAAHEREPRSKNRNLIDGSDDAVLFFDETKVPVEVIAVANEETAGLDAADFEVIGEKVSYRPAQRPGSYVILKYVRPVIKLRADQTLSCPSAPVGVLDGCRADVSFIAGMIIDKFAYHQPLYRQHVELQGAAATPRAPHYWRLLLGFSHQSEFLRSERDTYSLRIAYEQDTELLSPCPSCWH